MDQIGSDWIKWDQNWIKIGSKLGEVGPNSIELHQIRFDQKVLKWLKFELGQIGSNWIKLDQIRSILYSGSSSLGEIWISVALVN